MKLKMLNPLFIYKVRFLMRKNSFPSKNQKLNLRQFQVCILNFGARLQECLTAAKELESKGIKISIIDARFAKPLDQDLILSCARDHEIMLTIEEGSIGGFGSHVSHLLSSKGIFDKGLKFRSLILPDIFIDQDKPDLMYDQAGLNSKQITEEIELILFNRSGIKIIK